MVVIRSVPCAQSIFGEELPPSIFSTLRPNEVVLRPAESQTDVLRVAFHPRAVPTHHSTAADTVRPSLLLPETLGPKECFHVSGTTWLFKGEFGDVHRLQHDGYPAPSTRSCVELQVETLPIAKHDIVR